MLPSSIRVNDSILLGSELTLLPGRMQNARRFTAFELFHGVVDVLCCILWIGPEINIDNGGSSWFANMCCCGREMLLSMYRRIMSA